MQSIVRLMLALAGSYGFAWLSHYFIEDNTPASFRYPLWSLRADLLMYFKWLNGTLAPNSRASASARVRAKPATFAANLFPSLVSAGIYRAPRSTSVRQRGAP
jgi:peptidoglycan/LPS O-acetylase OafA/YrhL